MAETFQPIAIERFGPDEARLACCEDCDHEWQLDEEDVCLIDTEVVPCPNCGSGKTGPVWECPV